MPSFLQGILFHVCCYTVNYMHCVLCMHMCLINHGSSYLMDTTTHTDGTRAVFCVHFQILITALSCHRTLHVVVPACLMGICMLINDLSELN